MICSTITCSEGCGQELPDVEFDACNPDVHFGQVSDVFLGNIDYPFEDVNDAGEWSDRLAASSGSPDRIIQLQGIGDKPAAEETPLEISKGRTVYGPKKHTVNFRIDEVSDTNYEMARSLECNKLFLAWYKTYGGKLYGGDYGVNRQGVSVRFNHVIPEDAAQLETLTGSISWKNKFHPCRTDYPLQGDENNES